MKLEKYKELFDKTPSLKKRVESQKNPNAKEKRCLKKIYRLFNSPGLQKNKKYLREYFKETRKKMPDNKILIKSAILNKKIISSKEYKNAKSIFCYIPFDKELDTSGILKDAFLKNKIVAVPVVSGKNKMSAAVIRSLEEMKKNRFGIPEPEKSQFLDKSEIELVIAPALGYNHLGFRIGYGAGFYDYFLKNYDGVIFGFTLKNFISDDFLPDAYDIPVTKLFIL